MATYDTAADRRWWRLLDTATIEHERAAGREGAAGWAALRARRLAADTSEDIRAIE
jgi:hypothetical protein